MVQMYRTDKEVRVVVCRSANEKRHDLKRSLTDASTVKHDITSLTVTETGKQGRSADASDTKQDPRHPLGLRRERGVIDCRGPQVIIRQW